MKLLKHNDRRMEIEPGPQVALSGYRVPYALGRYDLSQVRYHRLATMDREESKWHAQLERRAQVIPEMVSLLLIHLDGGGGNA